MCPNFSNSSRRHSGPHATRRGFITGAGLMWVGIALGLFLAVALIQIAMHFDRLSTRSIAQLLVIPIVFAGFAGLVCWGIGRAVFKRSTIAGALGMSAVLAFFTFTRVLVMTGIITGSAQRGNLQINTPGSASNEAASNAPAPQSPSAPAPVMPNPVPANAPVAGGPPGGGPAPANRPGTNPFPSPSARGIQRDFVGVAEQISQETPAAREVLLRHARDLQGLMDGFATQARTLTGVLGAPATIDPATLRERIAAAQGVKDAGTRYINAAKTVRERIEADLRAEPRIDSARIGAISGRFVTFSHADARVFAVQQLITAGDDLTRQSRLVLDAPTAWTIDDKGQVNSTDLSKASEYRLIQAKLAAQRAMLESAVDRAAGT